MKIELVTVLSKGLPLYHLRLIGSNGRCMMHSENYFDRSTARRAAKRLVRSIKNAWDVKVVARYE